MKFNWQNSVGRSYIYEKSYMHDKKRKLEV